MENNAAADFADVYTLWITELNQQIHQHKGQILGFSVPPGPEY